MIYNISNVSGILELNAYNTEGMPLGSHEVEIKGHGKYEGLVRDLNFPTETKWIEARFPKLITGFELLGTNDGNELGGFTVTNLNRMEGVFPKLEKDGWTGIAFVNIGGSPANVRLTAYDDDGHAIAQETMSVSGHAKIVGFGKDLFSQDISNASYIGFLSSKEIVGFQLNASSEGTMLDGLPGS